MQNYLHDEDKGVKEETIFYFLDGYLFYTIHTRQMKLWNKSKNGNKQFQASVNLFIKCAGDISYILEKLYYVNLKFDYS